MSSALNTDALAHAEKLIDSGDITRDERDEWSEHAPSAGDENRYIDREGWSDYSDWHLAVDRQEPDETTERFPFPMGDYFRRIHRCAIVSSESRAAQHDHDGVARAAKRLLEQLDADDEG